MKEYNCDLQLHGVYAGGVSKRMLIPVLAEQAKLKGLQVLVTGDILHSKWMEHVKQSIAEESNGVFTDKQNQTHFIIGTEVEDSNRAHHLIYLPDLASAEVLREKMKGFGNLDCIMCGRPKLKLTAEAIAEKTEQAGGIIGPAHSFTPYTGIFAHHDKLEQAYGKMTEKICFIELGLSADTELADTMKQNHKYTFLSSSDAHSPYPNRLGREFNRIKMKQPSFKELKHALKEKLVTLNVGLDPREGKYHLTACNSCYAKYSVQNAEKFRWKCVKCSGQIKKGVRDRIAELADLEKGSHPEFRATYMHSLPLAEIIQQALKIENVNSIKVQEKWRQLVSALGNEIKALIDAKEQELLETDPVIGEKIIAFRKGWVCYVPGGGGQYGKPAIASSEQEYKRKKAQIEKETEAEQNMHWQKTLGEF